MTFIKSYITLDEAPEILRNRVDDELNRYPGSKILSVSKCVSAPYKDKNAIETRYTVHMQVANYFEVYKYSVCSNPEWTDREVRRSGMIASEIIEFVKHCEWLQDGVRESISRE